MLSNGIKKRQTFFALLFSILIMCSLLVMNVQNATADTLLSIPTWQNGQLNVSNLAAHSLTLEWSGAQDDVGVTGYTIYENGSVLATVSNINQYNVTGLQPETVYSFRVQALDADGNLSKDGPSITATTQAAPVPLTVVSAATDHLGKKITVEFNRTIADPAGKQGEFTVLAEKPGTVLKGASL